MQSRSETRKVPKQRHIRPDDRLADDDTIVIRGGELDPDIVQVDALRYHSIYGEYGISGVYLGVEAEIGREGVRRIVETDLTDTELAGLKEAAEAVRAKQADVQDL